MHASFIRSKSNECTDKFFIVLFSNRNIKNASESLSPHFSSRRRQNIFRAYHNLKWKRLSSRNASLSFLSRYKTCNNYCQPDCAFTFRITLKLTATRPPVSYASSTRSDPLSGSDLFRSSSVLFSNLPFEKRDNETKTKRWKRWERAYMRRNIL